LAYYNARNFKKIGLSPLIIRYLCSQQKTVQCPKRAQSPLMYKPKPSKPSVRLTILRVCSIYWNSREGTLISAGLKKMECSLFYQLGYRPDILLQRRGGRHRALRLRRGYYRTGRKHRGVPLVAGFGLRCWRTADRHSGGRLRYLLGGRRDWFFDLAVCRYYRSQDGAQRSLAEIAVTIKA